MLTAALALSAAVAASAQELGEDVPPATDPVSTVEAGPEVTATPVPEPLAQPVAPEPESTPVATATPEGEPIQNPATARPPEAPPPPVEPTRAAPPSPTPAAALQPASSADAGPTPRPLRATRTARRAASQEPVNEPVDLEPCADVGPQCGVPGAACTILGTPEDDELSGSPFDDIICGLGGDDVIDGNGGDDVILGGGGDDEMSGGGGGDCFIAGPGQDEIVGEQPGEPVAGAERGDGDEERGCLGGPGERTGDRLVAAWDGVATRDVLEPLLSTDRAA